MRVTDDFVLRSSSYFFDKQTAQALRRVVGALDDHDTRQYLLEAINMIELNGQQNYCITERGQRRLDVLTGAVLGWRPEGRDCAYVSANGHAFVVRSGSGFPVYRTDTLHRIRHPLWLPNATAAADQHDAAMEGHADG